MDQCPASHPRLEIDDDASRVGCRQFPLPRSAIPVRDLITPRSLQDLRRFDFYSRIANQFTVNEYGDIPSGHALASTARGCRTRVLRNPVRTHYPTRMELGRLRSAWLAFGAWMVCAPIASGWGPEGHRIVAMAAQELLNDNSLRRMGYLLGKDIALADVATWAIEIVEERPETEAWHSITIPPDAKGVVLSRDCPLGDCVTAKLRDCIGVVRLSIRPKSQIVESFKMLVSLVGDMHQPMLNGYPPAQGRENVRVLVDGQSMLLGEAWETGLIQWMGSAETVLERVRQRIAHADTESWRAGTYRDWTWETHRVAVEKVYPVIRDEEPETTLSGPALLETSELLVDQLAKSAVRLAYVLEIAWP